MGNSNGMISGNDRIHGNRNIGGMHVSRTAMLKLTEPGKSNKIMNKGEYTMKPRFNKITENEKNKISYSHSFVNDLVPKLSLY